MKFNLINLIGNQLHLGKQKKTQNTFSKSYTYINNKNTILDLNNTLAQLKKTLPLIVKIVSLKGKVFLLEKSTHPATLTNKQQYKQKVPALVVIIQNNDLLASCRKLQLPTVKIVNTDDNAKHPMYPLAANDTNGKSISFQKKLIKNAIKTGKLQEIFMFSKHKFPRLGSNQRPRT